MSERPRDTAGEFRAADNLRTLPGRGGGEYLEVKYRLLWLREDHPDAIIETEHVRLEDQIAVFRALVTVPGGGSATGYGSETRQDFADFIEKAETKAIGRALNALGYGTAAAVDEALADAPVRRQELNVGRSAPPQHAQPAHSGDRGGATPNAPQRGPERVAGASTPEPPDDDAPIGGNGANQLMQYAVRAGIAAPDLARVTAGAYGVAPPQVTRRQARELVGWLKPMSNVEGRETAAQVKRMQEAADGRTLDSIWGDIVERGLGSPVLARTHDRLAYTLMGMDPDDGAERSRDEPPPDELAYQPRAMQPHAEPDPERMPARAATQGALMPGAAPVRDQLH